MRGFWQGVCTASSRFVGESKPGQNVKVGPFGWAWEETMVPGLGISEKIGQRGHTTWKEKRWKRSEIEPEEVTRPGMRLSFVLLVPHSGVSHETSSCARHRRPVRGLGPCTRWPYGYCERFRSSSNCPAQRQNVQQDIIANSTT
eukprot:4474537-Amphidinium_carterae.1